MGCLYKKVWASATFQEVAQSCLTAESNTRFFFMISRIKIQVSKKRNGPGLEPPETTNPPLMPGMGIRGECATPDSEYAHGTCCRRC